MKVVLTAHFFVRLVWTLGLTGALQVTRYAGAVVTSELVGAAEPLDSSPSRVLGHPALILGLV